MKFATTLLIAATGIALATPAMAQFAKPEDAVKYRKASLTVIAAHFGRLGAMANGKMPFDAKVAAEAGDVIHTMNKQPWTAFVAGSDAGDTKAKPEIWKERAKFDGAAEKMVAETEKLAAAAKSGNLEAIKAAFGPAANTCKTCHDDFRAK